MKVEAFPEVVLYDPKREAVVWRHAYVSMPPEEYFTVLEEAVDRADLGN